MSASIGYEKRSSVEWRVGELHLRRDGFLTRFINP